MTSFVRIWRPSGLRCLTFRRKLGTRFERSKDCDSRAVPDPCCPPDPPCDPCPPPGPPIYEPHADPRKLTYWRMASLCVAVPLIVVVTLVQYVRHQERKKRPREPFMDLPYMYRRTKPFPWGDGNHSLFHNPTKNAVPPHGYEVEGPSQVPKRASN